MTGEKHHIHLTIARRLKMSGIGGTATQTLRGTATKKLHTPGTAEGINSLLMKTGDHTRTNNRLMTREGIGNTGQTMEGIIHTTTLIIAEEKSMIHIVGLADLNPATTGTSRKTTGIHTKEKEATGLMKVPTIPRQEILRGSDTSLMPMDKIVRQVMVIRMITATGMSATT